MLFRSLRKAAAAGVQPGDVDLAQAATFYGRYGPAVFDHLVVQAARQAESKP